MPKKKSKAKTVILVLATALIAGGAVAGGFAIKKYVDENAIAMPGRRNSLKTPTSASVSTMTARPIRYVWAPLQTSRRGSTAKETTSTPIQSSPE